MVLRNANALAVVLTCLLTGVFLGQYILSQSPPLVRNRRDTWKSIFDEPLHPDTTDCLLLFSQQEADEDFYSPKYLEHRRQLDAKFKGVIDADKEKRHNYTIQGHSGGAKHQSRLYHWLAARPWVNTVCETGFNAGHSTLQWLTGSDHAKVYSFDIGWHYYTRPMTDYLNRTFPDRFNLITDDSLQTIPRFAKERRDVKCDIIVVDGGHSHDVALGDIRNFRHITSVERNVLVVDVKNKLEIMTAWNEVRADGLAVERFACTDKSRYGRAYVVGYYV